jgi:hypothetical protein
MARIPDRITLKGDKVDVNTSAATLPETADINDKMQAALIKLQEAQKYYQKQYVDFQEHMAEEAKKAEAAQSQIIEQDLAEEAKKAEAAQSQIIEQDLAEEAKKAEAAQSHIIEHNVSDPILVRQGNAASLGELGDGSAHQPVIVSIEK